MANMLLLIERSWWCKSNIHLLHWDIGGLKRGSWWEKSCDAWNENAKVIFFWCDLSSEKGQNSPSVDSRPSPSVTFTAPTRPPSPQSIKLPVSRQIDDSPRFKHLIFSLKIKKKCLQILSPGIESHLQACSRNISRSI